MAKLHELIAVNKSIRNQADVNRTDLRNTFEKKRHLFAEKRVVTQPVAEGVEATTEIQSDIQTTVDKELTWIAGQMAKSMDCSHQICVGNTMAKADVVLEDGTTILKDVPASSLLELEDRIKEMAELIKAIPTLDPAKGFAPDDQRGVGYFRARDVRKTRTQKIQKPLVLYPATTEHPAQTQLTSIDEVVAYLEEQEWSTLITVSKKADLLDRAEAMLRAVKQARVRANEVVVDTKTNKVGDAITKFVFGV